MSLSRLANFDTRRRRQIIISRVPLTRLRDRQNPLEWYNAVEFKLRYHLYKDTAVFIVDIIKHDLSYPIRRGVHIPPVVQFLAVLRFYATGGFQISNADIHHLSQPTICNIVRRVSIAIAKLRSRFIRYPTLGEAEDIRREFHSIAGFPGVVGSLDCTHVHIVSPGGDDAELFRNRKGRFSVNVQAICDAQLCFTNLVARWYGSAHDSRIFENSTISDQLEDGLAPGILLGDGGYALLPYLMTPFEPPTGRAEQRYNYAQIRTRNTIERAFGVLKRRFPCLKKLRLKLKTSLIVIVAVSVLHNISRKRLDIYDDDRSLDKDDENGPGDEERLSARRRSSPSGNIIRSGIVQNHFA